jgi:hypothetical protein
VNAIEILPGIRGKMRPVRLVAQERAYTEKEGREWEPDLYCRGGQRVRRTATVTGTDDPELYRGERFGNLTYVMRRARPLQGNLPFRGDIVWTRKGGAHGAGSRLFDIFCNRIALKRNFDIYREAGGGPRPHLDQPRLASESTGEA